MTKGFKSYEVLKIIFDIVPEDVQTKHKKEISGRILTLRDQFSEHWNNNEFTHSKYENEEDLKRMILYCWWKYWDEYNICAFDALFI